MGKRVLNNFLEIETVAEANRVNLKEYYFDKFSESRGRYIFVRRRKNAS